MKKMYAQVVAVYVPIEIEKVNLQHRLAMLMHCRAYAQAGYPPN